MCSIALAWRVFDEVPVVVGANREEQWDRPADPPGVLAEDPRVVAPRDREAGGTWIGVNDAGLFAALTNRLGGGDGERSRGQLLRDVLGSPQVDAARELVHEELRSRSYAGFTLVIASAEAATVIVWDGEARERALDPGLHVIVNRGDDRQNAKAAVIRTRLLPTLAGDAQGFLDRLPTVLSDHAIGACVHGEAHGTRSSSILTIDDVGRLDWQFAEGPPCTNAYRGVHEGEL